MKNDIDTRLKRALKSTESPDMELIQAVKNRFLKEDKISMKKTYKRSFGAVIAAVVAVLLWGCNRGGCCGFAGEHQRICGMAAA